MNTNLLLPLAGHHRLMWIGIPRATASIAAGKINNRAWYIYIEALLTKFLQDNSTNGISTSVVLVFKRTVLSFNWCLPHRAGACPGGGGKGPAPPPRN